MRFPIISLKKVYIRILKSNNKKTKVMGLILIYFIILSIILTHIIIFICLIKSLRSTKAEISNQKCKDFKTDKKVTEKEKNKEYFNYNGNHHNYSNATKLKDNTKLENESKKVINLSANMDEIISSSSSEKNNDELIVPFNSTSFKLDDKQPNPYIIKDNEDINITTKFDGKNKNSFILEEEQELNDKNEIKNQDINSSVLKKKNDLFTDKMNFIQNESSGLKSKDCLEDGDKLYERHKNSDSLQENRESSGFESKDCLEDSDKLDEGHKNLDSLQENRESISTAKLINKNLDTHDLGTTVKLCDERIDHSLEDNNIIGTVQLNDKNIDAAKLSEDRNTNRIEKVDLKKSYSLCLEENKILPLYHKSDAKHINSDSSDEDKKFKSAIKLDYNHKNSNSTVQLDDNLKNSNSTAQLDDNLKNFNSTAQLDDNHKNFNSTAQLDDNLKNSNSTAQLDDNHLNYNKPGNVIILDDQILDTPNKNENKIEFIDKSVQQQTENKDKNSIQDNLKNINGSETSSKEKNDLFMNVNLKIESDTEIEISPVESENLDFYDASEQYSAYETDDNCEGEVAYDRKGKIKKTYRLKYQLKLETVNDRKESSSESNDPKIKSNESSLSNLANIEIDGEESINNTDSSANNSFEETKKPKHDLKKYNSLILYKIQPKENKKLTKNNPDFTEKIQFYEQQNLRFDAKKEEVNPKRELNKTKIKLKK